MTTSVRELIRTRQCGVVLFYGAHDFTPGTNFLFAVIPTKGRGAQWHRDVLSALRRYLKRYRRPFSYLVSGNEVYTTPEALMLFDNRVDGRNDRAWLKFEWQETEGSHRQGCFHAIKFPKE